MRLILHAFIVLMLYPNGYVWALDLSQEPIQPLYPIQVNPQKAALGKTLFFETKLSQDNTISCAHCHDLTKGGIDGLKHSFGVSGREGLVNAPTVFNAALNFAQFWDGRVDTLEAQIDSPITKHSEMAENWPDIITKLNADPYYPKAFKSVYPDGITAHNIKDAIAEFERTLITTNSRFDRYLQGDEHAINAEEKHGYALFKDYGCVACHQGRNVGGNVFQVLGVMKDYFKDHPEENQAAKGRFNITGKPDDLHRFKVPSLRLVVLTAPYFHNGSEQSLHETIHTMGEYQLGKHIPDSDVHAIIAFLYTLPGEYQGQTLEPKKPKPRQQLDAKVNP